MKRFILLLLVIAAIAPVSAEVTMFCNDTPIVGTFDGEPPGAANNVTIPTFPEVAGLTLEDANDYINDVCLAEFGHNRTVQADVRFELYTNESQYLIRNSAGAYGDFHETDPIAYYFKKASRSYNCGSDDYAQLEWLYFADIQPFDCVDGTYSPPVADFYGNPLTGPASLLVTFTDNSTNNGGECSYNWSVSPLAGAYFNDPNAKNTTAYFTADGNYTISHSVANSFGSNTSTKTDYIWVRNSSDVIRTGVMAVDSLTGFPIHGSQVDIQDIEDDSWTNTTTAGGYAEISTLIGHNLNIYGSATGYEDGDMLGVPAINQHLYTLLLSPTILVSNTTPGNVTLYITIADRETAERLPNIRVSFSTGASFTQFTNENGIARAVFPNRTYVSVGVDAQQGYQSATQTFYTGTAPGGGSAHVDGTILLSKRYVTTTPTVTYTGSATPTSTTTVDPYPCSVEHPENCQRKQIDLANTVLQYAPQLVLFFIMLTIVGGIKMIGK